MIQIWVDDYLISVQQNEDSAKYFCDKNNIENAQFCEVKE